MSHLSSVELLGLWSNEALILQHPCGTPDLKQAAITWKYIPLASGINFIDNKSEFLSHMLKIFSHGSICFFHMVQLAGVLALNT